MENCTPDNVATPPSRREFLAAIAATSATIAASSAMAEAAAVVQRPRRLIDVHHHILPPRYLTNPPDPYRSFGRWDLDRVVGGMDRAGVAVTIFSVTSPLAPIAGISANREAARECNEYAAEIVARRRRRFGFFATLPMPDVDGSLLEMAYALDELRADGLHVLTSYGVRWIGDPAFAPVLEAVDRRGSVLYIHPSGLNCCREVACYIPPLPCTRDEVGGAASSLARRAAATRFTNLRLIMSHGAQYGHTQSPKHWADMASSGLNVYDAVAGVVDVGSLRDSSGTPGSCILLGDRR